MLRARHLQEHRLFECYLAERQGESVDPRVAEHLADCETCAGRYTELTGVMEDVRTAAVAESDAVFTPEHLHAQQQQIARRIEHVGRHARVITFPKSTADGFTHAPFTAVHHRPRWVAAAVAAGLFVGVALGASFDWERRAWVTQSVAGVGLVGGTRAIGIPGVAGANAAPGAVAAVSVHRTPVTASNDADGIVAVAPLTAVATDGNAPSDVAADDAFLSELELALDRPRPRVLQPYDDITPHVREIRAIR